jgi:hypothetical protein
MVSFQIDRQGNMDGHCDYKFYTGATFSGEMRHGERSALPDLQSPCATIGRFLTAKQEWPGAFGKTYWGAVGNQLSTQHVRWQPLGTYSTAAITLGSCSLMPAE